MQTRRQAKQQVEQTESESPVENNQTTSTNGVSKAKNGQELIRGVPVKTFLRNIHLGMLASLVFVGTVTWVVWTGRVNLAGNVTAEKLTGFGVKSEFVFRYQILSVLWLLFNVQAVIYNRLKVPQALDPLSGHESATQANRNILQNSVEQLLITLITQLSVISYLSGYYVIRVIPLMNLFYFIGRIAFFIGYPRYRTFGFITTQVPPLIAAAFAAYRFGTHLGIY